jgi:hypothetical protein
MKKNLATLTKEREKVCFVGRSWSIIRNGSKVFVCMYIKVGYVYALLVSEMSAFNLVCFSFSHSRQSLYICTYIPMWGRLADEICCSLCCDKISLAKFVRLITICRDLSMKSVKASKWSKSRRIWAKNSTIFQAKFVKYYWPEFGPHSTKFGRIRPYFNQNSTKTLPKFYQNSTNILPKFGQNSAKIRPKFDQNSTKIRPKRRCAPRFLPLVDLDSHVPDDLLMISELEPIL